MRFFFLLLIIYNVQTLAKEASDSTTDIDTESEKLKCPKKGTHWCKRLNRCITLCKNCRAPEIIDGEYICGDITCREYETCNENITCIGNIAGNEYFYRPTDNDPCASDL